MKLVNYTIGADPEMFIINLQTNEVVSAKGIIPGEKGKPYTDGLPNGFGLEIDGILAEFNIPPCSSKQEYISSIKFMKEYIREFVKNINPDLDICCCASHMVPDNIIQDPEVNQIGCDPDFNAYTGIENPTPKGYPDAIRVAGDHIHFGIKGLSIEDKFKFIKYCDLALGLPSVYIDTDTYRRTLYGRSGSFRFQPWGLEYRSLSSRMLGDDCLDKVASMIEKVVLLFNEDIPLPAEGLIRKCIDTSNKILADHIVKLYKEICVDLLV